MNANNFKKCVYIVLAILVLLFYTKDIDFFKNDFYKNIKEITNPTDLLVLVNKNNILPKDYIPNDLEKINLSFSNDDRFLRKEAKDHFEKLSSEASKLGYKIIAVSAYRDYIIKINYTINM